LETAVFEPTNAEARNGMAVAQYIAGMAFSNVGLGVVHGMAHPLGAIFDIPHGVANALLLPTIMEFNAPAALPKYVEIAKAMNVYKEGMTQEEAEKEFASNVATDIGNAYSSGLLDEAQAEKMLWEYAGKDEEEAASKVNYWSFLNAHPEYEQYDLSESNVNKYLEFAEPEGISMEVFVQFRDGTKGLTDIKDKWGDVEVSKRDQVLEVIDSLPITRKQKDVLYLAAEYAENKIWDVPW
jgi:hypothetical protein